VRHCCGLIFRSRRLREFQAMPNQIRFAFFASIRG
jgi:hypothetical protein